MFIGHYAPAMVAAAHPKATGLGSLIFAAQLTDVAFFVFVIGGVEQYRITPGLTTMNVLDFYHMPYSHSLLGHFAFALAFGVLIWAITKNHVGALIAGGVVVSHWFVDLLVHVPDLTLIGLPPKIGLGLWDYPLIEIPLELGITFAAFLYYTRKTAGSSRSSGPLFIFAAALLAFQIFNWAMPHPTEPDPTLPYLALFAYFLFSGLAWWAAGGRSAKADGR